MPDELAKPVLEHNTHPLVTSYQRHLRAELRNPGTIQNYLVSIAQLLDFADSEGFDEPTAIPRSTVEDWLISVNERLRPATARTKYLHARLFFDWLVREGEIATSPFGPKLDRRIRPPEIPESPKDVVTPETMAALFRRLDKARRWRDAVVVAVLYDTGMRASELAATLTANVALDAGTIFIPTSKGKRTRLVRIAAPTVRYIDRYWRRKRPAPEYLVNGTRGPLTRSGVYQVVSGLFREVGLDGIGPHDLRHTSATHVAASRLMSESEMMTLYGWRSPEMARHYSEQARRDAALQAHEAASPMARLQGAGRKR